MRTDTHAFIYHAYDHYFCPMGYEICPYRPADAYKSFEEIEKNESEHWIFIGEPSKCYPTFHIKKWADIAKDLMLSNPYYYDIRKPEKGIQERKGEKFKIG